MNLSCREFRHFFVHTLASSAGGSDGGSSSSEDTNLRRLIDEYKEEVFGCASRAGSSFLMPCNEIPEAEVEMRFRQDPQVSFVVKAVSALTAAFRLAQLERCAGSSAGGTATSDCLSRIGSDDDVHESILDNLRKLSFSPPSPSSTSRGAKEVGGTQHHFTRNGRLVANKQQVYFVDRVSGLEEIGWYSEDEGLNLDSGMPVATAQPFFSPLVNQEREEDEDEEADRRRSTDAFARVIGGELFDLDDDAMMKKELETLPIFSYESFLGRTWALVVASAAGLGFIASAWMLAYVFRKMCDGTLSGNQTMGVVLLLGVMLLFGSAFPWLLPPGEVVCAFRHFLHPLLLVLCFSVLLVKSMQLRSLVTIGLGGTIPQVNQLLSLVFMVAVQVVIAAEWYLATRPVGIQITGGYPECGVSPARFLLLHVYPAVLLLLTFFYGVSVLKVKRNFNEGRWITCASLFIIPIFAAWPVVYYFAPVPFHDPSVAVSVVAIAGILLACIFLPKMHTIALQDRIKRASADLSRAHSDATVYTGFSDYAVLSAAAAASPKPLYPVYGYTNFIGGMPHHHHTPHGGGVTTISLSTSSRSGKSHKSKSKKGGGSTGNFRNISYVPTSPASGAQVKSYTDWSREFEPAAAAATDSQHHRLHLHHHYHNQQQQQQQHHHHHNLHPSSAVYSISSHGRPHLHRHHHSHGHSHGQGHHRHHHHHEDGELLGLPAIHADRRERRRRHLLSDEEEEEEKSRYVVQLNFSRGSFSADHLLYYFVGSTVPLERKLDCSLVSV